MISPVPSTKNPDLAARLLTLQQEFKKMKKQAAEELRKLKEQHRTELASFEEIAQVYKAVGWYIYALPLFVR
jgi:chaperonin cofactor prefoldin